MRTIGAPPELVTRAGPVSLTRDAGPIGKADRMKTIELTTRVCSHPGCGEKHKAHGLCVRHYRATEGYKSSKRAAKKARLAASPEKRRSESRGKKLRTYGLRQADFASMLTRQGNACAICCMPCPVFASLCVDHCHITGKVRGLLCRRCNTALGMFGDSQVLVERASQYLAGAL